MKTAFENGLLIDGNGGEPVADSLVLVEDKKIIYAGPKKEFDDGYDVRDISGKTIMPGLIDTHLHYSGNLSDNDTEWVLEPMFQKAVVAVAQAREALENGLTSVGEISKFGPYIRDMIERGVIPGPRTVTSGVGFAEQQVMAIHIDCPLNITKFHTRGQSVLTVLGT